MEQRKKMKYETPLIEVIKMENEGVIASSHGGDMNEVPWRSNSVNSRNSSGYSSAASSGDLEDLINDILTVEN